MAGSDENAGYRLGTDRDAHGNNTSRPPPRQQRRGPPRRGTSASAPQKTAPPAGSSLQAPPPGTTKASPLPTTEPRDPALPALPQPASAAAMNITLSTQPYTDNLVYTVHCPACWRPVITVEELSSRRGWWATPYWSWTPSESRTILPALLLAVRARIQHRRRECMA